MKMTHRVNARNGSTTRRVILGWGVSSQGGGFRTEEWSFERSPTSRAFVYPMSRSRGNIFQSNKKIKHHKFFARENVSRIVRSDLPMGPLGQDPPIDSATTMLPRNVFNGKGLMLFETYPQNISTPLLAIKHQA